MRTMRAERDRPDLSLEETTDGLVAGIDEAGRGPWAGPVIAAAVVLDRHRLPAALAAAIDDSKRLTRARRERVFAALPESARIGVGEASVAEIDELNVLNAALLAMQRAVAELDVKPELALVDGNRLPRLPCRALAVVGGDGRCLSIAAASIVAKVTRDRLMEALAREYPGYGWERNAGYGTAAHQQALSRLGLTPHHRRSFKPVMALLDGTSRIKFERASGGHL